ncbi:MULTISPECIES: maltose acetyltransferase domain-containing protein [Corynebacterium]|uniref:maltose acetyltransferase domain-containing protein n=1 Tax=Corynebacterium TaxID=1716 RepID=UPI001F423C3F|nr:MULTISPECIES: maltose acetyltransferase domain-containing protein [Corynebacterium]
MDSREQIEDKILCGQPFRPIEDPDLYYEMMEAAEKCHDLNQLRPLQTAEKQAVMADLLGELGGALNGFPAISCPIWLENQGRRWRDLQSRNDGT